MKKQWLWPFLPLIVGLIAALLIRQLTNNPRVYLQAEMSAAVSLLAVLASLVWAAFVWQAQRWRSQEQSRLAQFRSEAATDKRRFLHRLDHELKNPITAIRAGLANVSGADLEQEQQKALASIEAQAVRLSRLTADLRKIAELETRTLERSPIELGQLLTEVVEIAEDHPDSDGRQVALTIPQAPWPLPSIVGDRDLLFLAIYNLVENALKFTGANDTVELRAREDGRFVLLEVADTGPGITADELPHVWEELYRGSNGRGVPGSGLGLSLVKAVVERHGGDIALESRPGQGTLVSIHLPVT